MSQALPQNRIRPIRRHAAQRAAAAGKKIGLPIDLQL